MEPTDKTEKKLIKSFVKRISKNEKSDCDLRTLKIKKFSKKEILFSFLYGKSQAKMTYSYVDNPAENIYNVFLEYKKEVESIKTKPTD